MFLFLFSKVIPVYFCLLYFLKISFYIFSYNYYNYSMFRDVPECSRMFHVPGFIDTHFTSPFAPDVTKTRNGERGTGNGERGTGNGERGTGNGERGTGNGERGPANECTAVTHLRIQNGG